MAGSTSLFNYQGSKITSSEKPSLTTLKSIQYSNFLYHSACDRSSFLHIYYCLKPPEFGVLIVPLSIIYVLPIFEYRLIQGKILFSPTAAYHLEQGLAFNSPTTNMCSSVNRFTDSWCHALLLSHRAYVFPLLSRTLLVSH